MFRLIWLPALALAACGTDDDRRPRTVEYVTSAILAPSCGNAQCHSQFRQVSGYVFDTVENAQPHLVGLVGAIELDTKGEPVGFPDTTLMMSVLTRTVDRMPYDQPLPDPDIGLIRRWIEFGAPGAQCNPNVDGAKVCIGNKVYDCLDSFDYGAEVQDCGAMTCAGGACR